MPLLVKNFQIQVQKLLLYKTIVLQPIFLPPNQTHMKKICDIQRKL